MTKPADVQAQLRSLSISTEQRPTGSARSGGGMWKGFALGVIVLGGAWVGARYVRPGLVEELGTGGGDSAKATTIRMMAVTAGPEPRSQSVLTATGKIVSDHRVAVSTKVSGQIVSLHFEQGDRVSEGQVLARIEDVLYRARRDEAAARLERTLVNLAFQEVNFARVSKLAQSESAPDIEFADARRAVDESAAQVQADRATLEWTQKMLTDCEVRAPIAGVVLTRNVEVGDFVAAEGGRGANANAQFAIIADMTKLRVEVDISEMDIDRIEKQMPCVVTPDAYKDRTYRGFVMWIDPGANYSKATVQVKVRIENPDDALRVEGSAQVVFRQADSPAAGGESGPAIWIPTSACRVDESGRTGFVFRAVDGRLRKTVVSLGREQSDQREVVDGLSPGDSIAVEGVEQLVDGATVRP